MNGDERVPVAILFGDLKGSTVEAELDERASVLKLREYGNLINEAARRFGHDTCKVKTEGDGFMATFTTAHCMVECGFALQQEFRRRHWQVRLGGHCGDVYRTADGDIVGAVVNRAARIQSAADAESSQFLVSDVVRATVRNRIRHIAFEPRPSIVAKGVVEALTVFEVSPASAPGAQASAEPVAAATIEAPQRAAVRGRWRARRWAVAGVVLAAAVVTLALPYLWFDVGRGRPQPAVGSPHAGSPEAIGTIAVMEFENQRGDDPKDDWYCKALQTVFNTELSKIPQLSVVAPEIIQRVAREGGLDRIAAAQQLGVSRFITGSFAVVGSAIRMDARIVDPRNGLQETAENVEGVQDEFFSLQKKLALATLDHLRVRLTEAQAESFKQTTNSRLDKYRLLLGAEGVAEGSAGSGDAKPERPPAPRAGGELPPPPNSSWQIDLHLASVAYAEEPVADADAAARAVLEEYRLAHQRGDVDRLAGLYVSFSDRQRQKVDAYVKDTDNLRVELIDVKIQPRGDDLVVSYTRRDNFIDKQTGEPVSLEVRLTKFLVRDGGTWKFAGEGL